jgi:hypothetical protein
MNFCPVVATPPSIKSADSIVGSPFDKLPTEKLKVRFDEPEIIGRDDFRFQGKIPELPRYSRDMTI